MSAKKSAQKAALAPQLLQAMQWELTRQGNMRVPGRIYADAALIKGMETQVFQQLANVATLPGIVQAAFAMPDAHSGYGFPIGGVAAFDPKAGGVVSAGGVGFDIACGVRSLHTGLSGDEVRAQQQQLADALFSRIPAGLGVEGGLRVKGRDMDAMLRGGARWAVRQGFGEASDLEFCEEGGCMRGADPDMVSDQAKKRQEGEVGTLGSGNHYLELQEVVALYDRDAATAFGLSLGDVLCSIHCGSRGLGHQIGTDYLQRMLKEAPKHGLVLPDRELACAPLASTLGQEYLGAMRAGINCALANRQVLSHLVRQVFAERFPGARLRLFYDVSHNTCKEERHTVDGRERTLFVHRKGATRALPPGHPDIPAPYRKAGQPVLIGGSMGSRSYVLAGMAGNEHLAFSSANHGAGRRMSRGQAKKEFRGRDVLTDLLERGIHIRAQDFRGVAEEAPGAYKDVDLVVEVAQSVGLARKVAALEPLVCIKG